MSSRSQCTHTYKSVLTYLLDMRDLCRRFHRHDLVENYTDAWETAAIAIYGQLPPRVETGYLGARLAAEVRMETKTRTQGQREMRQKPIRKVIMRVGEEEVLECGHRIWHPLLGPEEKGKRRRCTQCLKEARVAEGKKAPTEASASMKKKGSVA